MLPKFTNYLLAFMISANTALASTKGEIADYLGIGSQIHFENVSFQLAWSAHPQTRYFKQEYLPAGESLEQFKSLLTIDVLFEARSVKDIVTAKITELEKLKESNPVVQYATFEKDGEVMLDFLLSQNTADGKRLSFVERNVYRYKAITDAKGVKGVMLFAFSSRAYGNGIDSFFRELKDHRFDMIKSVGAFSLPSVTLADKP